MEDCVGCVKVSVSPVGERLDVRTSRVGSDVVLMVWKIGGNLRIETSPVCSIGDVDSMYIPFLVVEGEFILSDSKVFKVLRYELSE
jgi:hypothetical protein